MKNVSILFTQKNSIYNTLGVDTWDILRDADNYPGHNAVVCHPPCRAWGRLRYFAKPRSNEKQLAINAIGFVRKYGGVLEHPAGSKLWSELKLPLGKEIDSYGGFTISINQSWFGHKAKKNTWLYVCGIDKKNVPALMLSFDAITHIVGTPKRGRKKTGLKELSKKAREATPINLAIWLIELAQLCYINKNI